MRVELLYFPECPNVNAAREQLRRALAESGLPLRWTEHDVTSPRAPKRVRGFGSPTILVDGQDVSGASSEEAASCRVYLGSDVRGVPPLETIVQALKSRTNPVAQSSSRAMMARIVAVVPALLLSMLPVLSCPACWPAYAGVLSSLGVSFLMEAEWLLPLTGVALAIALFTLGFRARRRRGLRPLALGVAGSAAILLGRFVVEVDVVVYIGAALLIGASVWNSWPKKGGAVSAGTSECNCVEGAAS